MAEVVNIPAEDLLPGEVGAEQAPDWAQHSWNGSGHHATSIFRAKRGGDCATGTVVGRAVSPPTKFSREHGSPYLDISVEYAVSNGKPIIPGTWLRVYCSPTILREWLEQTDPQPGDKVAIKYDGRDNFNDGTFRHAYSCGTVKAEPATTAPWE